MESKLLASYQKIMNIKKYKQALHKATLDKHNPFSAAPSIQEIHDLLIHVAETGDTSMECEVNPEERENLKELSLHYYNITLPLLNGINFIITNRLRPLENAEILSRVKNDCYWEPEEIYDLLCSLTRPQIESFLMQLNNIDVNVVNSILKSVANKDRVLFEKCINGLNPSELSKCCSLWSATLVSPKDSAESYLEAIEDFYDDKSTILNVNYEEKHLIAQTTHEVISRLKSMPDLMSSSMEDCDSEIDSYENLILGYDTVVISQIIILNRQGMLIPFEEKLLHSFISDDTSSALWKGIESDDTTINTEEPITPDDGQFVQVRSSKLKKCDEGNRNKELKSCLDKLYHILKEENLLEGDQELFVYRFSGIGKPCAQESKLKWYGKNVLLGHIVRCLLSDSINPPEKFELVSKFFESKSGKNINLATAKYENGENFDKRKNCIDPNFVKAVEILRDCGFINVEYTSKRR